MKVFRFLKEKKYFGQNKSILNGALFSGFSFINRGFSFLLLLILANYITPEEYGYLSLFSTIIMVIGYFMALSTEGYLPVSYFREGDDGVKKTFSAVFFTTIIVSISFFLLLLFFGGGISKILQLPINTLYLAIVISFFTVFTNMNLDYFRFKEQVTKYGIFSCFNALINFILSILLVKTFMLGWVGRVFAQAVCFFIFGLLGLLFFIVKKYIELPNIKYWKSMIIWGIPLIPHLGANFIRQGCDRYIINYTHSIQDVGLFSFALNLANIITMIGLGFNQSNSVDIYKVLGDSSLSSTQKLNSVFKQKNIVFKIYLSIYIGVSILCYLLIPIIMPNYKGAMNYFLLTAIWALFQCLYFLYTNFLFYYKKTKDIMYITFGSAVLHLILSLFLTRYSLYFTSLIYILTQSFVFFFIRKKALFVLKENLSC